MTQQDEAGKPVFWVRIEDGAYRFFPWDSELINAFFEIQFDKMEKDSEK